MSTAIYNVASMAADPGEQLAILQIKGAKQAAQKLAILEQYQLTLPDADTSRFMKGV